MSAVIRLRYKAGHDLEGNKNGNCLARMVLTASSIPYSIRIGGESHNNIIISHNS